MDKAKGLLPRSSAGIYPWEGALQWPLKLRNVVLGRRTKKGTTHPQKGPARAIFGRRSFW